MKAETILLGLFLVCIALTLSACTPQEIAKFNELDEHTKEVLITYTTPQAEPPKMIETFTTAEKTKIINPYFSVQNSTGEIFRVDHEGNFYLYPLTTCGKLYTDGAGLLTCGTDDAGVESLSSADDYISVDNPTGAVEIDFNESKFTSVYYNATTSNLVAGILDGGTLDNTRHSDAIYDGITMNFSEVSGSPGLDVRVNFTVDSFNRFVFRYKTSELKGDYPLRQMWDYDNSVWEDYHSVGETTTFSLVTQPVFDNEVHVQDGIVQLRLYKASVGNTQNHYYIDWVAMIKGFGTPSGVEVDPLSFHKDENIDNTGYSITADTFIGNVSCKNITGATSDLCTLVDTDTTYTNASFDVSQLANTANVDIGNYNLTVNGLHLDKINSSHHRIWS